MTDPRPHDFIHSARIISDDLLPRDWSGATVDRSLVDDLATVLSQTVVGWNPDLSQAPEVRRVLARYRQETGRG